MSSELVDDDKEREGVEAGVIVRFPAYALASCPAEGYDLAMVEGGNCATDDLFTWKGSRDDEGESERERRPVDIIRLISGAGRSTAEMEEILGPQQSRRRWRANSTIPLLTASCSILRCGKIPFASVWCLLTHSCQPVVAIVVLFHWHLDCRPFYLLLIAILPMASGHICR